MKTITINVRNKIPRVTSELKTLVADNTEYRLEFEFDGDWQEGPKQVILIVEGVEALAPLTTAEDAVTLPAIRITDGSHHALLVGVQQGDTVTTRPAVLTVYPSAKTELLTAIVDDARVPLTWLDWVNQNMTAAATNVETAQAVLAQAQEAAETAEQARDDAVSAKTDAEAAAAQAAASASSAGTSAASAGSSAQTAETAKTEAQTAASQAAASESSAGTSAASAGSSAQTAETAKTAAQTAASQAAASASSAGTSATSAESSKHKAELAENGAEFSQKMAEAARSGAEAAAAQAAESASSAGTSATSAGSSAQTAETAAETATAKASEASASASAASSAATTATEAKNTAQTAAQTATTKAGEASASAESVSASAAQIATNTEDIADLKTQLSVVVILTDVNGSDLWANGAIGSTDGVDTNNNARIRTASALSPDILQIKNSDATVWKYMIFAYTSNTVFDSTTYVGVWFPNNQTKFVKSANWITEDTDIATLDANYPSGITKLYYRIVVAKQASGQLINKNDDYAAIQLIRNGIKVDKTLTKSGIPADAKAVSDAIAVIPGKNLEYYQLENKSVYDFLNDDSLSDDTSYTSSVVENYIDRTHRLYSGAIRRDHPAPIRNVFNSIDNLGAGESPDNQVVGIWVSDDNFGHYQYFKAIGNYIEINNLIPGRTYKYRVYGFTNTFDDRLIASGSFITNAGVRMCNVPGIQNVRDLGGWTGLDSRKVIYGNLYRGCELVPEGWDDVVGAKIWDEGIEICRNNLKIRSELDLTTIDRQESLFGADIEYFQIDAGAYADVITSSYYRNHFKQIFEWMIKQLYDFSDMSPSLSVYDSQSNYSEGDYCLYGPYDKVIYQATQDIEAEPWTEAHWKRIKYDTAPRPIYFHCQGGNDRTGTLSALLLALLGVDEFTISQEYELSAFSQIGFNRRRNSNNYKGLINALKSAGESDDIGTAAYNWATTLCEISESDINTFRNLMLNVID